MAAVAKARRIEDAVLGVLSGLLCDGPNARITAQLDRKLYIRVNDVLEALGGKWDRRSKAHVFPGDAAAALEAAIITGEYARPGDFGFFPTPPELARYVVDMADVVPGCRGAGCWSPAAAMAP